MLPLIRCLLNLYLVVQFFHPHLQYQKPRFLVSRRFLTGKRDYLITTLCYTSEPNVSVNK